MCHLEQHHAPHFDNFAVMCTNRQETDSRLVLTCGHGDGDDSTFLCEQFPIKVWQQMLVHGYWSWDEQCVFILPVSQTLTAHCVTLTISTFASTYDAHDILYNNQYIPCICCVYLGQICLKLSADNLLSL
jgi:hypothetical protein